ncbi:hypothetical protein ACFTXJ_14860 [Streptomyces zhihengii]|uniref:hypothetical protein n=1 Tax=Streptomyces zhihengii TaxID=1818004 RepID=UPI0036418B80
MALVISAGSTDELGMPTAPAERVWQLIVREIAQDATVANGSPTDTWGAAARSSRPYWSPGAVVQQICRLLLGLTAASIFIRWRRRRHRDSRHAAA